MKKKLTTIGCLLFIGSSYAVPQLDPTPVSPYVFQVNGPTVTITLTNNGSTPAALIDTSGFDAYFTRSSDLCFGNTINAGVSCTFDLTPLPNVSLPTLTSVDTTYYNDDFTILYDLFIDVAILQVGDAWQGGTIYQINQAPNAFATGLTVVPNVATGAWSPAVCTGFTGGGNNNWVMPTMGDLNTIWPLSNCNGGVVSGFSCAINAFYWSSDILNPPPPTNDGSFYVQGKNFGRNCNGADKNIRSHITACVRTFS